MAGTNTRYTIRQAREILAKHGMTIRSTDGEYRVAFKGPEARTEPSAYYTTDLLDAVDTGIDMAERAALRFAVAGKIVPNMEEAMVVATEVFATSGVVVAIEYV